MRYLLFLFAIVAVKYMNGQVNTTVATIAVPAGFTRCPLETNSFGAWLRTIPLKKDKTVYLYNGQRKANQSAQYAVLATSVGTKDLQQCADAVMRLRAEYLYSIKTYSMIAFHATDGTLMDYESWRKGYRFVSRQGKLQKLLVAGASEGRTSFDQYLETVFSYAGTLSLSKELAPVPTVQDIMPGDVFIKGGSPGHAVIVLDVATNKAGKKIFMLAQSYMPAQDIHILKNPSNGESPWYNIDFGKKLITPEWVFDEGALRRIYNF